MKEKRVYVVDANKVMLQTSNGKFMDLAEESGEVYTLKGFNEAGLVLNNKVIRIL